MEEDIYDLSGDAHFFGDYTNAWYIPFTRIKRQTWDEGALFEWIKSNPIKSCTDRYCGDASMSDLLGKYPMKVARLDRLSVLANQCTNIEEFKCICNELFRLTNGRVAFEGALYSPDLIEI